MTTLLGASLAMLLAWNPTNGFDPTMVRVLRQGTKLLVEAGSSAAFDDWLNEGNEPARRAASVRYFVTCAFPERYQVLFKSRTGARYQWNGALGLATGLTRTVAMLAEGKPAVSLALHADEGKWVSACVMALANMAGKHQYVSLRGNPPAWTHLPEPGERWTMGYPEGAFFADLLNFNVAPEAGPSIAPPRRRSEPMWRPSRCDLEQSYTLSLDLPEGYLDLAAAGWAPPNASNGRTLDYDLVTRSDATAVGQFEVAARLGTYLGARGRLSMGAGSRVVDDDYPHDSVFVANRAVVDRRTPGARWLRPLFVHAPRVVSLAGAGREAAPAEVIEAVDTGATPLGASQRTACQAGRDCTGPFVLFAAGQQPVAPPAGAVAQVLDGLAPGQQVTATLRFHELQEGFALDDASRTAAYTAIIRYRSRGPVRAKVEVIEPGHGWKNAEAAWTDTRGEWAWLQVYPVHVVADDAGLSSLLVRISGPDGGAAPTLDLAGFVMGRPWCWDNAKPFASTCPDGQGVPHLSVPRRILAVPHLPRRPGPTPAP